ncbi:hypothetical protein OSTOST_21178, partial [Ostertagia ostertagi]
MKPFACEKGNRWKVYSRSSMATRKHYQKTARVGDVIVQGEPGTSFYSDPSKDYYLSGDHGYDFINPSMQTVFFANGSLDQKRSGHACFSKYRVPQLVLGSAWPAGKCAKQWNTRTDGWNFGASTVSERGISPSLASRISAKLACALPKQTPFQISSTSARCIQNYCEKTVIVDAPVAVSETLTKGLTSTINSCHFVNSKYGSACSRHEEVKGITLKSLSADSHSEFSNIWTIEIPWKSKFVT